ncbi:MAG: mechanosensitive ion channel family protein [Planctomycetia bacterium]|nr:mechanosensitive ion channel family protein [Planctomycetia bacterium]
MKRGMDHLILLIVLLLLSGGAVLAGEEAPIGQSETRNESGIKLPSVLHNKKDVPSNRIPKSVAVPAELKQTLEQDKKTSGSDPSKTSAAAKKSKSAETANHSDLADDQASVDNKKEAAQKLREINAHRQMDTPKNTIRFFIDATDELRYSDAVFAMDFRKFPDMNEMNRQIYAYKLAGILSRLDNFNLADIPDEDYDDPECYLWPDPSYNAIVLKKHEDGIWVFSSATVAEIPQFFTKIEHKIPNFTHQKWIRELPEFFFYKFAGLVIFQWGILLIAFLGGILAARIIPRISSSLVLYFMHSHQNDEYTRLLRRAIKPLAYFLMVLIWYGAFLISDITPGYLFVAERIMNPLCVFIIMISLLRFVDIFRAWFRNKLKKSPNKIKNILADFFCGILKFVFIGIGCIGIAQLFGFSALGIVSGMGIGGIAVALAAQHTISNFFGSLTILFDQPFMVGDRVVINNIEGLVENVGLRSTRIRTLYDSVVLIPNSQIASSVVDNLGRRSFRRFTTTIGLQYDTPVGLFQAFCSGVREILHKNSHVKKDNFRVHVYDFAASSIDIKLVCFLSAKNNEEEEAVREDLLLEIIALAQELGVSFAFPTQVNYVIPSHDLSYPLKEEAGDTESALDLGKDKARKILEKSIPAP